MNVRVHVLDFFSINGTKVTLQNRQPLGRLDEKAKEKIAEELQIRQNRKPSKILLSTDIRTKAPMGSNNGLG